MAARFAVANGNFNATSTWATTAAGSPGASVPIAGDSAYANSKTVTITADATCDLVSTENTGGATASGGFTLSSGVTLTASVTSGGSACVTASYNSPGVSSIIGNVTGSTTTNNEGLSITGTGTVNVTGNVSTGTFSGSKAIFINGVNCTLNVTGAVASFATSSNGIFLNTVATVSITGNISGGSSSSGVGISTNTNSSITIIGSVTAGSGSSAHGANNNSTGTISITGTVTGAGGVGCINSSTGTVTIIGNAIAGATSPGAQNSSSGTLRVVRAVGNAFGVGSAGGTTSQPGVVSSTNGSLTYVEEIEYGSVGQSPTSGPILFTDKTSNVALFYRSGSSKKTLIDAASVSGALPAASNVRYGISFNAGNSVGTCYVPSASSVAYGVNVDNTTGTAILTGPAIWDILTTTMVTSGSIGSRLKNCSTIQSTDSSIANAIST